MKLLADLSSQSWKTKIYWWTTTLIGLGILGWISPDLAHLKFTGWLQLVGLAGIVFLAGLFPVRIPGTQCVITPSDIFIFFTCLILGVPATTLIAALDSFVGSYRSSPKWTTRIASLAISAISMFLSASLFQWLQNALFTLLANSNTKLFLSLSFFAVVFFLINSLLMAIYSALKQGQPLFHYWWSNYMWLISTYAASASVAGLIQVGWERYGFATFLAAMPIVGIVFTTFHFYFKQAEEKTKAHQQQLEAAEAQTALAEKHLKEMQESEDRFRSAFDYAAIGMALVAPDGRWVQVNTSLCQILGYSEPELLTRDFQGLTHPDDVDSVRRSVAQLISGQVSSAQIEHRFIHHLGHEVWVSLNASSIRELQTHAQRLIFQVQNITDRKMAEARLIHDAFHDSLTGLPNRSLFLDHLQMALARNQRHPQRSFAVLFLDFDRFKIVNDSLGHLAGDELLIQVARRLQKSVRPGDTIARLGGDEFTILIEEISDANEAVTLAERIQQKLMVPIKLNATEVTITVSIGIAMSSTGYKRPEEVLRDADTAMYQAKFLGKARFALFDPSMHTRAITQLQLENDLRRAVERHEFFLVYQPIVSLVTARLIGFEALVRWQHPERGFVSPADFIPVAEETGLIIPLGQWVIEEACRQMQTWEKLIGKTSLTMSINLSGKQLSHDHIVDVITQVLQQTNIDPHQLKLEITESVVMENIEIAIRKLNQMRDLGVKLSIDDFGTGYSSLSYLHRLPTDTLKVDRSFVFRMSDNNENAEIVRTIVMLAQTLKMDVTAEGIETMDQLGQLQKLGVEFGQGYLFAKPQNIRDATELVLQHQSWLAFEQPEDVFTTNDESLITSNYTV